MLFLASGIVFLLFGLCALIEYKMYRLRIENNFNLEDYFSNAFLLYIWGVGSMFSFAFSILKNEKIVFFILFISVLFFSFYGSSSVLDYFKLKRKRRKNV